MHRVGGNEITIDVNMLMPVAMTATNDSLHGRALIDSGTTCTASNERDLAAHQQHAR